MGANLMANQMKLNKFSTVRRLAAQLATLLMATTPLMEPITFPTVLMATTPLMEPITFPTVLTVFRQLTLLMALAAMAKS